MVGKYLHHQGVGCYGVTWHQCTYQGEDDYCPSGCLHDLLCEKGAMELVVQSSRHSPVLHHCILCESLIQWLCPESIFELNSSAATVTSSKTAWVKNFFVNSVVVEMWGVSFLTLSQPSYTTQNTLGGAWAVNIVNVVAYRL